jgi:hypothetical protein
MVLALAVLTALACAVIVRTQDMPSDRVLPLGVAWLLAAGLAGLAWPRERLPRGELAWDGESWWYSTESGATEPVCVSLNWDAGRAMLLNVRSRPAGGIWARYFWLQASQLPRQWHALRCAVYGRDTL